MGPIQPAPAAKLENYDVKNRVTRSSSRVSKPANEPSLSSSGVKDRIEAIETVNRPNMSSKHARKASEPRAPRRDIIACFEEALSEREKELEEQQAENKKLERRNIRLRTSYKEQAIVIAGLESDKKDMEDTINTAIKSHLDPYAKKHGTLPDGWKNDTFLAAIASLFEDAEATNSQAIEVKSLTQQYQALQEEMCKKVEETAEAADSKAAEIASLTRQIRTLQKEMLAKVEKVDVASDEKLAQEFRVIMSLVRTLSRTIRVDETIDVAEILGRGPLQKKVSHHHWIGRARKKLLVEGWIWSVLIFVVFRTPFMIFGKEYEALSQVWCTIFGSEHCNGWPNPTALSETWRYTTMESMLATIDPTVITHGTTQEEPDDIEIGIAGARTMCAEVLRNALSRVSSGGNPSQIETIVNKAFALAMQMSVQRVRLQITYPTVGDIFDNETMNFLPDPDGADVDHGTVAFTVNPGLSKWGDAHGKNLEHRYDIVPSQVQLEAPLQEGIAVHEPVSSRLAQRGRDQAPVSGDTNEGDSQR
ncbi:hypothetical protein J4E85_007292 [Alternaria conjuncta]|uniref:uncharacterized protein n=1 Tax=Alternaria conjuncta TaxID=181017 RepID=UPI00221FC265|nr:uncharacterized protein J4E85_007292 [Alternaria conjuncta]KAI4925413.1 hypothetical protein J4E85_007292 [Alternaria conjuncta]